MSDEYATEVSGSPPETLEHLHRRRSDRTIVPNWIAIVVLSVATLIVSLPRLRSPIDIRWDAGTYYVLGTSLAHGTGYRLLNEPGNIQETEYPPVVPLVIAAHQLLLGTTDYAVVGHWLQVTWLVFLACFVTGSYVWLGRYVPQIWSFTGALMCLLNFDVYFHSGMATSDLPFALTSLAFLLLYRNNAGAARGIVAGAAAIASFLIRTVGVALFVAWIAEAALRGELRRAATRCAVAGVCVLGWYGYVYSVESSPGYSKTTYSYQRAAYQFYNVSYARNLIYIDPFHPELGEASRSDRLVRFLRNAKLLPASVVETLSTRMGVWIQQTNKVFPALANWSARPVIALMTVIGLSIIGGLVLLLLQRERLVVIYTTVSFAVICAMPWPDQTDRYLMPLVPVFALALFSVVRWVIEWAHTSRVVRYAALAIITCLLLQQILMYGFIHHFHFKTGQIRDTQNRLTKFRYIYYENTDVALDDCLMWIAHHAERSDIIATSLPQRAYILTGLKVVMAPFEMDSSKAHFLLDTVPVRYLLVQNVAEPKDNTRIYMLRMVRSFPDKWHVVYDAKDVRVYERVGTRL